MDAAEFAEWIAFHTLEPFGAEREDFRFGVVASAAVAPWTPKGKPPTPPLAWFEAFHEPARPRPPSAKELRDKVRALTLAMGGSVAGRG